MICPLCQRDVPLSLVERHHLSTRRKDKDDVEDLCGPCHRQIHVLFRDSDLRNPTLGLDTIDGLLENEQFQKFLAYIRRQPVSASIKVRESARRKRR